MTTRTPTFFVVKTEPTPEANVPILGPSVSVEGFKNFSDAATALREAEYRDFLEGVGCPPNKIDAEVVAYFTENLRRAGMLDENGMVKPE